MAMPVGLGQPVLAREGAREGTWQSIAHRPPAVVARHSSGRARTTCRADGGGAKGYSIGIIVGGMVGGTVGGMVGGMVGGTLLGQP